MHRSGFCMAPWVHLPSKCLNIDVEVSKLLAQPNLREPACFPPFKRCVQVANHFRRNKSASEKGVGKGLNKSTQVWRNVTVSLEATAHLTHSGIEIKEDEHTNPNSCISRVVLALLVTWRQTWKSTLLGRPVSRTVWGCQMYVLTLIYRELFGYSYSYRWRGWRYLAVCLGPTENSGADVQVSFGSFVMAGS